MGLASYYRRFIPQFTKVAHPLHCLARKNAPFHWSSECQEDFQIFEDFAGHSFQIGAATAAAKAGVEDSMICTRVAGTAVLSLFITVLPKKT